MSEEKARRKAIAKIAENCQKIQIEPVSGASSLSAIFGNFGTFGNSIGQMTRWSALPILR